MSDPTRRSFLSICSLASLVAPLASLFAFTRKDVEAALEPIADPIDPPKKSPVSRWIGAYTGKLCASLFIQDDRACLGLYGRITGRSTDDIPASCDFAVSADPSGKTLMQIRGEDGKLVIIDLQKIAPFLKTLETMHKVAVTTSTISTDMETE